MNAMRFFTLFVFALVCAVAWELLAPAQAWCWGPGVHVTLGNAVLGAPELLPAPMAELLLANTRPFLYGAISADIFIGKGSRIKPGHSHNWDTGFSLLEQARKERDPKVMAYAWGYMSHLAADTVAHNCYVPNMMALTPLGGRLAHVYTEAQADRAVGFSGRQARQVFHLPLGAADRCLLASTGQRSLPFKVKKRIFASSLAVSGAPRFRKTLRMAESFGPTPNEGYLEEMVQVALVAVLDVLRTVEQSPVVQVDPIGAVRLARAPKYRKRLRLLARRGRFRPAFRMPEQLRELHLEYGLGDICDAGQ